MSRFWAMLALKALQFAAENGQFSADIADQPVGKLIARRDDPRVKDKFLNIRIGLHRVHTFEGYFQFV